VAYDEKLAGRVREVLGDRPAVSERRMFGGLCFLVDGKMAVGINDAELMVRVGADGHAAALKRAHVRPMDFTGKPLTGFVYVGAAGYRGAALARWVDEACAFVATLPAPKARKPRPARPRTPPRARR
jgi:hypothetical protein